MPYGLIPLSYCCFTFAIRKPFMTKNAKQTMPAYGCLVAINTITVSIEVFSPLATILLYHILLLYEKRNGDMVMPPPSETSSCEEARSGLPCL